MSVEMRELGAIRVPHATGTIVLGDFTTYTEFDATLLTTVPLRGHCAVDAYGSYDVRVFENSEYSSIILLLRAGAGFQPCDFWKETEDDMLIPNDLFELYKPVKLGTVVLTNYILTIAEASVLMNKDAVSAIPDMAASLAERSILDLVLRGACNAGHNSNLCALRTTHSPYTLYGVKKNTQLYGYDALFLFEERFIAE